MKYKRKEIIGDCTLYLADCMDILPHLDKVDAVVTSPPYDNLRSYGDGFEELNWRSIVPMLSDAVLDGGVVMWNVADATILGSETGTSFRQTLLFMDNNMLLHDTMIYIKNSAAFPDSSRYYSGFEYMFVFSKNMPPKTFNPIKDRRNKSYGRSVTGTERQKDGSTKKASGIGAPVKDFGVRLNYWLMNNHNETDHPATMPYAMAHDHIESWSNQGETILDPFMGSGTTGVACAKMGRKFIGIELDSGYFDIACKRIRDAYNQPDLFVEPPAPMAQEGMDI